MSETLIKVENISKKFCKDLKRSLWYGMKDLGTEILGLPHDHDGRLRKDEFWAVKDVSFELKRGECLGLIGRNGAGKTTLLRILNGLIKPDKGRIEMRGQVGALIALGAGFNPVLTGRENIYINASVLGLRKREIDAKLDEIISFAELDEFIDAPVQSYSSGMNIRLGFSIATALMPDVLLLDEVLAVGDASFRFKCHRRIIDVLKNAAVIFVSHDIPHIARLCDQTMVLKQGEVHFLGETSLGVENYRTLNEKGIPVEEGFLTLKPPISNFEIGIDSKEIRSGNPMNVEILLESSLEVDNLALRINIFNLAGAYAADCIVNSMEYLNKVKQGINKWQIEVTSLPLKAGRYQLLFSVADNDGDFLAVSYKHHEITITGGCPGTVADCQLALRSWITY